jgi:hypothetical protein
MAERNWPAELAAAKVRYEQWQRLPVIPTWSRLEPLSLTRGDLAPGAQVLVADPLWMIGRQWQFDELRGEDAGSPIIATVEAESAPLTRFRAGSAEEAVDMTPADPPLEVRVEAEQPPVLPMRLRTHTGLHLLRLLRAAGLHAVAAAAAAFAPGPAPGDGGLDDPVGDARLRLAADRVPDGAALLAAVDEAAPDVPAALAAAGDAGATREVLAVWRRWAHGQLAAPSGPSWNPHHLEHRFTAQATLSDGAVVVDVGSYTGGTLDWFHGDLTAGPGLGAPAVAVEPTRIRDTTLPMPVRFAGMPSDRLFAFEDAAVYLGGVQAGRTDLARMAVVEFALAYSVDWFLVPLVLPYGTVTRFDRVRVVDTFGVEVDSAPAREATRPGWTAFQSTPITDSSRLSRMFVLAPTVPRVLEGEPLEEVALFRDEMANLVWGVERTVPGPASGEPVARARQAARVTLRQSIPDDLGDAAIVYRLMTPVPENWIPLVAVRSSGAEHHELERRPMVRHREDGTAQLVHPTGTVLLSDPAADPATDRLRIAEHEVPREGVVVTRSFQMARTAGGGTALWIGRRVRTGRGEGASGLRFDTALPPGGVCSLTRRRGPRRMPRPVPRPARPPTRRIRAGGRTRRAASAAARRCGERPARSQAGEDLLEPGEDGLGLPVVRDVVVREREDPARPGRGEGLEGGLVEQPPGVLVDRAGGVDEMQDDVAVVEAAQLLVGQALEHAGAAVGDGAEPHPDLG